MQVTMTFLVLFLTAHTQRAQASSKFREPCSVVLLTPREGEKVIGSSLVTGIAEIPPGSFLWVFAHREGLQRWWPQGDGAARLVNGKWKVLVTYGKPGELGTFEIVAVVVGAQANEDLRKWTKSAAPGYEPTELPSSIGACPTPTVVVDKHSG
jgi:hypothetical protein